MPLASEYFIGMFYGCICQWIDIIKEIAAAFFVFTLQEFRKVLAKLRPAGNGAATFCKMKEIPVLEARVADDKFQVIISGCLDSVFESSVIIDVNYTKDFVVVIAYCAGFCIFLFFCIIDNAYRCAAALFAADFYVDRGKA